MNEKIDAMPRHEKCFYYEMGDFKQMSQGHSHFCVPADAKTLGERWERKKEIDPEGCKTCKRYKCRYIEYPLTINGLDIAQPEPWNVNLKPVRIHPCGDSRTYFGIYLGEFPRYTSASVDETSGQLKVRTACNPCIYVPKLQKVVFGDESWWGEISPGEDITDITDETINGQWYMQLLATLTSKSDKDGGDNNEQQA